MVKSCPGSGNYFSPFVVDDDGRVDDDTQLQWMKTQRNYYRHESIDRSVSNMIPNQASRQVGR